MEKKYGYTLKPQVGFESVMQWHALDRAAAVVAIKYLS